MTGDQLTASSVYSSFDATNAILNNQEGAWVAATNDLAQWLQINLYRQLLVSGVVIQGRPDVNEWVTTYLVEYAIDGVSWEFVRDGNTTIEVCDFNTQFKLNLNRTELFVNNRLT